MEKEGKKVMETDGRTEKKKLAGWRNCEKNVLCKQKNPHSKVEVFPNLNVDNVDNSVSKQMFTDVYDISGAHSYQQVAVHTIF